MISVTYDIIGLWYHSWNQGKYHIWYNIWYHIWYWPWFRLWYYSQPPQTCQMAKHTISDMKSLMISMWVYPFAQASLTELGRGEAQSLAEARRRAWQRRGAELGRGEERRGEERTEVLKSWMAWTRWAICSPSRRRRGAWSHNLRAWYCIARGPSWSGTGNLHEITTQLGAASEGMWRQ